MRSDDNKRAVPWRAILTSKLVWVNAIAQWGGIWALFTLLAQTPTYFRFIHGWGIEMTGILSGLPHLLRVAFSILFSNFGDYLLSNGKISRNNLRRLATFISKFFNQCQICPNSWILPRLRGERFRLSWPGIFGLQRDLGRFLPDAFTDASRCCFVGYSC